MYLIHHATSKHWDGLIEVNVTVVKEKTIYDYTFTMNSVPLVETFHNYYKQGRPVHGKAMAILRDNNISFILKKKRPNPRALITK
jgi:hypothetical protein